ncbi:hypothetical protein N7495_008867 [Penicillium taxi]|uniref:uncharacterized protein n=1 Tax=Penicillium taxi TaxID=168475 RepID=UPI0025457D89|nr:uncharacterized protein N7495_008867 [Penicillium taxi]KAJ5888826.1 hypothetical protein N7495_008867 [Penicillium taxi]
MSCCRPQFIPRLTTRLTSRLTLQQSNLQQNTSNKSFPPFLVTSNVTRSISLSVLHQYPMDKNTPSPSPAPVRKAPPGPTAGAKRKRNATTKYYAVKKGSKPGIYDCWPDCLKQITGFKGAIFQSFLSFEEAKAFLDGVTPSTSSSALDSANTRFYGIQRGRVPGVYTDWSKAQEQIQGFTRPVYRKFSTRGEAEEFVKIGRAAVGFGISDHPVKKPTGPGGITSENPKDADGVEFAPGDGPLPPGAEDGFDPNVLLDPSTGNVVYKSPSQKAATKTQSTGIPGMLRIYTDGSSLRNGTPMASAGVGVYFGPKDARNVSEPLRGNRQTNQRAELTAILRAIDITPRHRDVTIFTDSRYSIDCVTNWFVNWRRNDWKTKEGKPVENRDLVESILVKIEERNELKVKTLFQWIKGHSSDPGNEAADRLAVSGAHQGVAEKAEAIRASQDMSNDLFDVDF